MSAHYRGWFARVPVYEPLPYCLAAAVAGILLDAWLSPRFSAYFPFSSRFIFPLRFWGAAFLFFAVCGSLMSLFSRFSRGDRGVLFRWIAGLAVCGAVTSFFGGWHYTRWNVFPRDEIGLMIPAEGADAVIEGIVRKTPVYYTDGNSAFGDSGGYTSFEIRAVRFLNKGTWKPCSGVVRVSGNGDGHSFRIGSLIHVTGRIAHIESARNPGDISPAFRNRLRRILVCMNGSVRSASPPDDMRLPPAERVRTFVLSRTEPIRLAASERIRRKFAETDWFRSGHAGENAGMASAILLGLRHEVDDDTIEMFRRAGISHLLAVSGLHVWLAASFFLFVFHFIPMKNFWRAFFLALAIGLYVLLAGAGEPAVRAAVLFWTFCVSFLMRRRPSLVNSYALSALVILLINPANLFQMGVHFSFLATGTFLWFVPIKDEEPKGKAVSRFFARRFWGWRAMDEDAHPVLVMVLQGAEHLCVKVVQLAWVSFLVELLLLPSLLINIKIFTPLSFLVNPIVWIPFYVGVVTAILFLLLGWVPFFGALFAGLSNLSFGGLRFLIGLADRIPNPWYRLYGFPFWWTLLFYLPLLVWTLFPYTRPSKKWIALLAMIWVGAGFTAHFCADWRVRSTQRLDAEILSVGHGSANMLFFPSKTVVLDCGTNGYPPSAAWEVENVLFAHRRRTVDLLCLSHPDSDHFNGAVTLVKQIPVRRVAVPPDFFRKNDVQVQELKHLLEEKEIPMTVLHGGENLGGIGFEPLTVLHPDSEETPAGNAGSLVLELNWLRRRLLFTGDLDADISKTAYLKKPVPTELITVPHHGGASKSTAELLRLRSPDFAVISESSGRFDAEILQNWREDSGLSESEFPRVISTAESGAVCVRIEKRRGNSDEPGLFTLTPFRYPECRLNLP